MAALTRGMTCSAINCIERRADPIVAREKQGAEVADLLTKLLGLLDHAVAS
jgi:hypothetical protein